MFKSSVLALVQKMLGVSKKRAFNFLAYNHKYCIKKCESFEMT
ncbi:hypothetical protein [Helicobacter cetorum]|nr:hypothetical protein [Helicobacter cetorum]